MNIRCIVCGKGLFPLHIQKKYCGRKCRSWSERFKRTDLQKLHIRERMQKYGRKSRSNCEYMKKYNHDYVRNNWSKTIIFAIKSRCKKSGKSFNLVEEDIIVPKFCPILGIELRVGNEFHYNSPSVDRIDNSKGYLKYNIQVISQAANAMKSDMPIEIWESVKKQWKGE